MINLKPLALHKNAIQNVKAPILTLAASFFFVLFCNWSFWQRFIHATGGISLDNAPLQIATFIILVAFLNVALTFVAFRFLLKPILIILFLATSAAAYFMDRYGILIDANMIQNIFETHFSESLELLSWRMLAFVLILGVLPSIAIWRIKLHFAPVWRDLLAKAKIILFSLIIAAVLLVVFFKSFAPIVRQHRELRFLLTPTNYIQATNSYIKRKFSKPQKIMPLGIDAVKGPSWKNNERKTVTVVVVGETARAMNFSLNGYGRNTNPELSGQNGLINFSNMQSCGTATAISVPCLFSPLGREKYSDAAAKSQESLLDVLSRAGFNVVWLDNNSGCKGTCDRVQYENISRPAPGDPFCPTDECYDERLLQKLPEIIRSSDRDLVIVLHQKGSHGPAYWKRYPKEFERFSPVCTTSDLQKCSTDSIVNAYDNTILYADYFLSKTIGLLRRSAAEDKIDASFVYFSDHGESLGEKNMYLHGAPYIISPVEQRHVPFMLWFSDGFQSRFRINTECLISRAAEPFTHDNIFHSILGMLNVNTAVYKPALDLFKACGI